MPYIIQSLTSLISTHEVSIAQSMSCLSGVSYAARKYDRKDGDTRASWET